MLSSSTNVIIEQAPPPQSGPLGQRFLALAQTLQFGYVLSIWRYAIHEPIESAFSEANCPSFVALMRTYYHTI